MEFRHSVRIMLFSLHEWMGPNMLFWRYVIDLALHNLSISGLLLLFQNLRPLQMLSVVLCCQCLVVNVRGAAVDVPPAPVASAAAAAWCW